MEILITYVSIRNANDTGTLENMQYLIKLSIKLITRLPSNCTLGLLSQGCKTWSYKYLYLNDHAHDGLICKLKSAQMSLNNYTVIYIIKNKKEQTIKMCKNLDESLENHIEHHPKRL